MSKHLTNSFNGLSLSCSQEALGIPNQKLIICTHCSIELGSKYFPENANLMENPMCFSCITFNIYKPCNVCFYTQPYEHYTSEEWLKKEGHICNECKQSGKHCRSVK